MIMFSHSWAGLSFVGSCKRRDAARQNRTTEHWSNSSFCVFGSVTPLLLFLNKVKCILVFDNSWSPNNLYTKYTSVISLICRASLRFNIVVIFQLFPLWNVNGSFLNFHVFTSKLLLPLKTILFLHCCVSAHLVYHLVIIHALSTLFEVKKSQISSQEEHYY